MNKYTFQVCSNQTKQYHLVEEELRDIVKHIFLDLAFNSPARWDKQQKTKYCTSVVRGQAPSKIIIANVDKCLASSDEGSEDYNYFKEIKENGYNYVAIDGNNRTITICEFLNNQVSILQGNYTLPNGHNVQVKENQTTYEKLPTALKDYIDQKIVVTVDEYTTASRASLHDLFLNVNDGFNLNPQELRNAKLVPYAGKIRDLVTELEQAFKYIFKDNGRRKIDEQLVMLSVYDAFGAEHGISKNDKDQAYEDNSLVSSHFNKFAEKNIRKALNIIIKYAGKEFKDVSTLLNFYMMIKGVEQQGRKIIDEKSFYEYFMSTESIRVADDEILYKHEARGEARNYLSCCSGTSEPLLKARYEKIMIDLSDISKGIVTDPLDTSRLFTVQQRRQLWEKQNGVCPKTNKTIPAHEINNNDKWAADHIVPHSKGGKTTIDNGQLVIREYNLSKGSKSENEMEGWNVKVA